MKLTAFLGLCIFVFCFRCSAQQKSNFFDAELTFFEWKKSFVLEIDSLAITLQKVDSANYNRYKGGILEGLSLTVDNIKLSLFTTLIDSLQNCKESKSGKYYIVIRYSSGEFRSADLFIRKYDEEQGCQVHYYIRPGTDGVIFLSPVVYTRKVRRELFEYCLEFLCQSSFWQ